MKRFLWLLALPLLSHGCAHQCPKCGTVIGANLNGAPAPASLVDAHRCPAAVAADGSTPARLATTGRAGYRPTVATCERLNGTRGCGDLLPAAPLFLQRVLHGISPPSSPPRFAAGAEALKRGDSDAWRR